MNKYNKEVIDLFKNWKGNYKSKHDASYIGTTKFSYSIDTASSRKLIKDWLKIHPNLSLTEFIDLLNDLALGKSSDEVMAIGKFLEYCPKLRAQLDPKVLDGWLDSTEGWAEVDTICAGTFDASDILLNWPKWEKILADFSKSPNVHKRRASLVTLVIAVRHSDDKRLSDLALRNVDNLKDEKDILITKAISWILRDLIKYHRRKVVEYLAKNEKTLPKIAIRETKNKLEKGRKSGK